MARPGIPTFAVAQTESGFQQLTPNRDTPILEKSTPEQRSGLPFVTPSWYPGM